MALLLPLIIFVASFLCFLIYRHRNNHGLRERAPEAAGSWPIIGHLHLLAGSELPHKLLGSMADKFGPVFTMKFGVRRVLVVSNADMAKECLATNDKVFASRPKAMATELMAYNYATFGLAPYAPYWRLLRRIIVLELGSQRSLRMIANLRVSEVKSSIKDIYTTWVKNKGSSGTVMVDMKQLFEDLIVNIVVKMMFDNQYKPGEHNEEKFQKAIQRFAELLGTFVPSDAVPWLRWLDIGGYAKKMKQTALEMDAAINGWLEVHKKKMDSTSTQQVHESKDQTVFMAALLSRVREEVDEQVHGFSTDEIVKATCLGIYTAASDTTAATLTWALALLVNNPQVLKKAQEEIETHVGRDRKVEESDMNKLVYLQAIFKETMRLYPAAPLSAPHESTEDCIVAGYTIPKGTRLVVNVWKIQHDPQIWTDPFEFRPERFLTDKKDIDVMGRHFELIPFSSGRRICAGISFALEAMYLALASVIQGFEFHNPSNNLIDMTETPGLANHKKSPLELLVAPRLSPHLY